MSFHARVAEYLRCPFCTSDIRVKRTLRPAPDGGIEYGLLECQECRFDYPIVDGIPILMAPHESVDSKFETTSITLLEGPRLWEVTAALQAGEPVRALALLFNPSTLGGDWFPPLDPTTDASEPNQDNGLKIDPARSKPLARAIERATGRGRRAVAKYLLPHARLRLADFLKTTEASLTALDVMNLYYRRFSGAENYYYFAYRFGQPRHLAALALASLMDSSTGPILDLACGAGHLTHYLSSVNPQRTVIGVDRDFVRMWIASRFVAPSAQYVCASADQPLPFAEGLFHGVLCSDAFHCFLQRAGSVRQMLRVMASEGLLVLARFANADVAPREGYELSIGGYARLLGGVGHKFVCETDLLKTYLEGRRADLSGAERPDALRDEKWVSLVATRRAELFRRGEPLAGWPHAVGRLRINPIYAVDRRDANGGLSLRFKFPSDWYEFENKAYLTYAPEHLEIPGDVVRALERGDRHADIDRYVRQFVVIGMPERYR